MKNQELTSLINFRLEILEDQIKARPLGGDFDGLRDFLNRVVHNIQSLLNLLDKLDSGNNNTRPDQGAGL